MAFVYTVAPGLFGFVFMILMTIKVDGGLAHVAWYAFLGSHF